MTKEECAIVTLYTGVAMLEGDDLEYLYRYAEKLMERPVLTHELVTLEEELKKRAEPDFINLCRWAGAEAVPFVQPEVRTEMSSADTISRQAAIDAIDKYSVWVMYTQGDSQNDEAELVENIIKQTKKAIQSMLREDLPSAQPETHDKRTETHACDCISRQAAIDYVDDIPFIKEHPNIGLLWKAWLEQLPPAQPERNTGRWIKDEKSYAGSGLSNYLCDQCEKCGGTWRSDLKPHQFPKFCMWCGAKMEVEHDG